MLYVSTHQYPCYPGTGAASEVGHGAGRGRTVNVPIEFGTPRREFLSQFGAALEKLADRIRPQLVIVSERQKME